MCGRFSLTTPPEILAEHFDLAEVPDLEPRYNIAPTQDVAVVRESAAGTGRRLDLVRWGLVPGHGRPRGLGLGLGQGQERGRGPRSSTRGPKR